MLNGAVKHEEGTAARAVERLPVALPNNLSYSWHRLSDAVSDRHEEATR